MRSSVVRLGDRRRAGAARDAALERMRRARTLVTGSAIAMAAAFTALAQGATPPFNKHRAATVAARPRSGAHTVVIHPSDKWPHRKHRHRRRHPRAASVQSAPPPSAPTAPATPPPAAPAPPPAAPAPAPAPAPTTSGGS
jgi:hypothetical protein